MIKFGQGPLIAKKKQKKKVLQDVEFGGSRWFSKPPFLDYVLNLP